MQIVHDLKNQINGLKLYATFLRKRLEKAGRPEDEQETVAKLIAGLERAAADMNVLVRFGRGVELRRQPGTDLARLVAEAAEGFPVETDGGPFEGDYDPALLGEALKSITAGALGDGAGAGQASPRVRLRGEGSGALVEWAGAGAEEAAGGGDPFRSLAGATGLRMALAARIVRAHGGEVSHEGGRISARLPLQER